jgi:aryl carrier-like protein
VSSAVAIADRRDGDARILGYVVATPGAAISGTAVRAALAHRVPRHLIPSAVTVLDRWPVTANGKLDHARLPLPLGDDAAAGFAAPESRDEILVARIAAQLLGLERVGVHDNLFELGMDSLQAMRLASSIATATQRELRLSTLFDHPTVFELARALGAARSPAPPIHRLPR